MIRYALVCSQNHEFESWFKSSEAFDILLCQAEVCCPVCGDAEVRKAIMAPAIARKAVRGKEAEPGTGRPEGGKAPPEQAACLTSDVREKLNALRQEIERTHDYVGDRFAEEARKMHFGEIEHRGIYGEATREQATDLAEEGVEVSPLPFIVRTDA